MVRGFRSEEDNTATLLRFASLYQYLIIFFKKSNNYYFSLLYTVQVAIKLLIVILLITYYSSIIFYLHNYKLILKLHSNLDTASNYLQHTNCHLTSNAVDKRPLGRNVLQLKNKVVNCSSSDSSYTTNATMSLYSITCNIFLRTLYTGG